MVNLQSFVLERKSSFLYIFTIIVGSIWEMASEAKKTSLYLLPLRPMFSTGIQKDYGQVSGESDVIRRRI